MNLEPCFICGRPVLELKGQFIKLDTYNLERGDRALTKGAFGWCHLSCLSNSEWGRFWSRRMRDRLVGRGYVVLSSDDMSTALELQRTGDLVAIRTDGLMFSTARRHLEQTRPCDGGVLVSIEEECNIELDDGEVVERIRTTLSTDGQFPLVELIRLLDLDSVTLFPHALKAALLRYDRSLRGHWKARWISARASYAQFIPSAVLSMFAPRARRSV